MNKEKLKQLRSLILEMEEEKERQHTLGAWSLFRDDNLAEEKKKEFLCSVAKEIEEIPDSLVRRAIKLHYVDGKTWAEVSFKMGYVSHDNARKIVVNYFKKKTV